MKIKITDIPPEGRDLSFELEHDALNSRIEGARSRKALVADGIKPPAYVFLPPVDVSIKLEIEGTTVVVSGRAKGSFSTSCSRCAEGTDQKLDIPVDIFLKPITTRGPDAARDEDVNYGYYDGQEVDCSSFVEEFLVLALPYTVFCAEECLGLCSGCGANLNVEHCTCSLSTSNDAPFAQLRDLKLVQ